MLSEGTALSSPVIAAEDLVKYFDIQFFLTDRLQRKKRPKVHAVDNVSFAIERNETVGLVGESGSGKTTLGRCILMLEKPTSGKVVFQGKTSSDLHGEELRLMRKKMQIVFQNPYSSLDPRTRVEDIVAEPLRAFRGDVHDNVDEIVSRTLSSVNLPHDGLRRFPHEFSGGQRQRIAIARALVLNPEFIVLDEPTGALDSSVQAQTLNLLRDIQEERGLSYLFITHNVNVVKYMADRVIVMYCGKFVEVGHTRDVLEKPLHPYTSALMLSVPRPNPKHRLQSAPLTGEVPSTVNPPQGCRFNPRCPYAVDRCRNEEPMLREVLPGHWAACHFSEKLLSQTDS